MSAKKILWVGDAVVSSGFAMASHAVCDHLHETGWEVHVLGVNYYGNPHEYPYLIYPAFDPLNHGQDQFGIGRLPYLMHSIEPDVVVIMTDPWHIPVYLDAIKKTFEEDYPVPPIVGWLAVDGMNQKAERLNDLAHVATWTAFGAKELQRGGYKGECSVVPLGYDPKIYYPRDKSDARLAVLGETTANKIGLDALIFGAVGRNQPRKRLDLTLEYFAEFLAQGGPDNAYLYLHVGPTGDVGVDLKSLCKFHGLKGRVIIGAPEIGHGLRPELMPFVYSMLDVYVSTSQGEGWGLPALEAMACGVPCILPAFAAFDEWPEDAALLAGCYSSLTTAPINGLMHTIGGIPDRNEFVEHMLDCTAPLHRRAHATKGLRIAAKYPWSATARGMAGVLDNVLYNASQTDTTVPSAVGEPPANDVGSPGEPIPADDEQ